MTVTLRDRHHLHLVLLAGLRDRPASGADLDRELARRSGGRLRIGVRTVYAELHHLARNDLVASDGPGRYRLTDAGLRSLRHRERQWDGYTAAVDGVLATGRPDDSDGRRAEPDLRAGPSARRAARSPR
ncbi:PadR family transcriptional regulator [Pseudonocardia endophytica]|uniref:DNA-binding PadR family transcriptional regulator n=1 Tax=Pseudonocardia endophytica TaxID=401976 RepID=A0A4R1HYJ1_PSEEN|nr:PadR family transcriptional regulator [Pseudonocardia endophytica]TCK22642.1 DNA-binding PadR family transcriptional regulator [Pseudonocardia endophytica]